jgi:hypothetical protein
MEKRNIKIMMAPCSTGNNFMDKYLDVVHFLDKKGHLSITYVHLEIIKVKLEQLKNYL